MATTDPRKTGFQIAPFLGTFAWASAPSASASGIGAIFRASDVGIAPGMLFVSDGTRWIPDGPQILARSGEALTAPLDTNENILATVTVKGGIMGISGSLRITTAWVMSGSGSKTVRARLGGIGGTQYLARAETTNTLLTVLVHIANRGAANSQTGMAATTTSTGLGSAAASLPTGSLDTAADTTLVLTGQKATGTDAIVLDSYRVELLP